MSITNEPALDLTEIEDNRRKLIEDRFKGLWKRVKEKPDIEQQKVESKLWEKVKKAAKKIGQKMFDGICYLWDAMTDPNVPFQAKLIAIAALAYFVSPVDAYPDFLPGGYADDGAVIAAAVAAIGGILVSHGTNLNRRTSFLQEDK